eukprot:CAMPEP_0204565272 /NCGR_PEP_ID=MMETSP0661-20131031/35376_1 /ASSEMBLY_ACC=CAM_ASM_000606 /TAXON_ID=109239 /ORGANISM="Alexandrium margalefi, Strain AMGDE01CS-322" /LENGTH=166 /DNA_ID=CAMNT_0051573003 /DNA_START=33 /DNA_END=530 /DNA_ORIENTATION=+
MPTGAGRSRVASPRGDRPVPAVPIEGLLLASVNVEALVGGLVDRRHLAPERRADGAAHDAGQLLRRLGAHGGAVMRQGAVLVAQPRLNLLHMALVAITPYQPIEHLVATALEVLVARRPPLACGSGAGHAGGADGLRRLPMPPELARLPSPDLRQGRVRVQPGRRQ